MIELKEVSKNFGLTHALNNVNLKLGSEQCIGLIGPNACGKTTMIKSILSIVVPTAGDILIDGKSIKNDVSYKSLIGYMPQIGRYPENMSIGQVVDMIKSIRNNEQVLDLELWDAFNLDSMKDKKMHALSGGTIQKVSATIAFMFNPKILILDEPTAGLDPLASEILRDKIKKERNNGKLIIITSHLLNELNDVLSHIVFMEEGKIVFYKDIESLLEETGQPLISKAISYLLKNLKG
ncbi:MAG TPA: ABC transporter ATP-binding protein [Saprospiraceae bacterium]|nr:ABC transporter ATP-binding protein [Saprospiraceae bacterium]HRO08383.1 ABC transporter ATP-binding protein [Saprospiraceae bacterium]HRO72628.1 ABC transporter ATP-binding protein [Saprospiraceae bacterium]HRP41768.1 ABC transporter ATP-binding protein [Saprospiraceae bacterium]